MSDFWDFSSSNFNEKEDEENYQIESERGESARSSTKRSYSHATKRVYHVNKVSSAASSPHQHQHQQRVRVTTTPRHFHTLHKQSHIAEHRQKIKTVNAANVSSSTNPISNIGNSNRSKSGDSSSSVQEIDLLTAMRILGPTHSRLLIEMHRQQQLQKAISKKHAMDKSLTKIRRHGVLRSSSSSVNSTRTSSPSNSIDIKAGFEKSILGSNASLLAPGSDPKSDEGGGSETAPSVSPLKRLSAWMKNLGL